MKLLQIRSRLCSAENLPLQKTINKYIKSNLYLPLSCFSRLSSMISTILTASNASSPVIRRYSIIFYSFYERFYFYPKISIRDRPVFGSDKNQEASFCHFHVGGYKHRCGVRSISIIPLSQRSLIRHQDPRLFLPALSIRFLLQLRPHCPFP